MQVTALLHLSMCNSMPVAKSPGSGDSFVKEMEPWVLRTAGCSHFLPLVIFFSF